MIVVRVVDVFLSISFISSVKKRKSEEKGTAEQNEFIKEKIQLWKRWFI